MRKLPFILVPLILALAGAPAAADLPPAVARYIDDTTIVVGRIDASKFDADAIVRFVEDVTQGQPEEQRQEMLAKAREQMEMGKQQIQPLLDAGVTQAYFIVGAAALSQQQGPLLVVPIEGEQQAAAVAQYAQQFGRSTKRAEDVMLVGDAAALQAAGAAPAADRPLFAEGLGGAGDSMLQVAIVPTPMVKMFGAQMLRQLAQQQPPVEEQEPGAEAAAKPDLTRAAAGLEKLEMITLHLGVPPEPRLRSETRFSDAETAQAMADASKAGMAAMQHEAAAGDPEAAAQMEMFKDIEAKVQGNSLVVDLSGEQIRQLVRRAVAEQARQQQEMEQEMEGEDQ